MEIQYKTKIQKEQIRDFTLEIECLEDLNKAIDDVFKYLEDHGDPRALEELCPYFGVVWPAARGLAEYLATLPREQLEGKRILELGCGLAIPSMIAEKRGASVTATDFHPMVPRFLNQNIQLNRLKNITYREINWEKQTLEGPPFDWVIGSDILYEGRFPQSLARALSTQIVPGGTILVADPGRPYLQSFVDEMKKLGFDCRTEILKVPNPPVLQDVFVLGFKK